MTLFWSAIWRNSFAYVISFQTPHNLHLLYCCVLICLLWQCLYGVFWTTIWRPSVFLLRFPFLSRVQSSRWYFACFSLEICVQLFFFSFLFCRYCCSVDVVLSVLFLVSVISLSLLFSKLWYQYIDIIFNAGESSSSFFS